MSISVLDLELPYEIVTRITQMATGEQVHLMGCTTSENLVGIELQQPRKNIVRLIMSGVPDMLKVVGDTYRCCIASVSNATHAEESSAKENKRKTNKCQASKQSSNQRQPHRDKLNKLAHSAHKPKASSKRQETLPNLTRCSSTRKKEVIRRSSRLREANEEGIIKRLNMIKPRKRHRSNSTTRSKSKCTVADAGPANDIGTGGDTHHVNDVGDTGPGDDVRDVSAAESRHRLTEYLDDSDHSSPEDGSNLVYTGDDNPDVAGPETILSATNVDDTARVDGGIIKLIKSLVQDKVSPNEKSSEDDTYFLAARSNDLISFSKKQKLEKLAFKCPLCKYAALNRGTFKYHLKAHHELSWKQYRSNYCHRSLKQNILNSVNSDVVDLRTTTRCINDCDSQETSTIDTMNLQDFRRQKRKDLKPRKAYNTNKADHQFACEVCDSTYSMKGSLRMHLRTKHKDVKQLQNILSRLNTTLIRQSEHRTNCPYCDLLLSGERIFTHMKLCHIEEVDFEDYYAITEKIYRQECYQKHRDDYVSEQKCPLCGVSLKKCSMKRHIDNHCKNNAAKQNRFHCHLCSYHSADKEEVARHKAVSHTEKQQYVCETCGARYTTTVGLRQHARIKHQTVWKKPLQWWNCLECNKQFTSRLNLDRHKPVHTREYRHVCGKCGKKFKDPSSLATHCRNIHEGAYRYKCDQCGHGVDRPQYLLTHKCDRVRRQARGLSASEIHAAALQPVAINSTTLEVAHTLTSQAMETHTGTLHSTEEQTRTIQTMDAHSETRVQDSVSFQLVVGEEDSLTEVQKQVGQIEPEIVEIGDAQVKHEPEMQSILGAGLDQQFRDSVTFVLHGDHGDQVAMTMRDIERMQAHDGSIMTLKPEDEVNVGDGDNIMVVMDPSSVLHDTEHVVTVGDVHTENGERIVVVMDTNSDISSSEQSVALNATLQDGSTVILLPNSNTSHPEDKIYAVMDSVQYL